MVLTTVVGLQPCSVTDIPVDLIRENIISDVFCVQTTRETFHTVCGREVLEMMRTRGWWCMMGWDGLDVRCFFFALSLFNWQRLINDIGRSLIYWFIVHVVMWYRQYYQYLQLLAWFICLFAYYMYSLLICIYSALPGHSAKTQGWGRFTKWDAIIPNSCH